MLIPCIDLMGGKVVQLVQGERKALEFDDPEPWVQKFAKYPLVHVVDLDAAMCRGSNRDIIARLVDRLNCQVGGGVRHAEDAMQLLALGAKRVVVGSALIADGKPDATFAKTLAEFVGIERLVFSVDAKHGNLAVRGWTNTVPVTAIEAVRALENFCSAFLYTNIDQEGGMGGFPMAEAQTLRATTKNQLMVGGGINSMEQVQELDKIGVDAVVGMAVYTGTMAV